MCTPQAFPDIALSKSFPQKYKNGKKAIGKK